MKMLCVLVQGLWIPVLHEIPECPTPIHIVVHPNKLGGLTEEEWLEAYRTKNKVTNELQFFPLKVS